MELTKWNEICEMEQYQNYTLMIKNQNILATLIIFLSQLKTYAVIQKRYTKETNTQNCHCWTFWQNFKHKENLK